MIPNKFHFIFGLTEDFGGKPFNLIHYLAIKSAYNLNKPEEINFYYKYEPFGELWNEIKPLLNLVKVEPPEEVYGNKLVHIAHKADIIRLQALYQKGGIYMDIDTICVKSFTELLNNQSVMGIQGHTTNPQQPYGLCNAIILAEPENEFIGYWLSKYESFNHQLWDTHSVQLPWKLYNELILPLTVLDYDRFHYPLHTDEGIKDMFVNDKKFPNAYAHHLWESNAWRYMSKLTRDKIEKENTTYNRIARKFL
jgi:hypothetical protein